MYELIAAGEKTYYINCPAKMGIYLLGGSEVCLIDSGNDQEAGKKVLKILNANGWVLKMILNTHSHADHIGGNSYLQKRTGCSVYAPGVDRAFTQHPILEPSFLYGGFPPKALKNKFLLAQGSDAKELTEDVLPNGLRMMRIDGHSFSMAAIKTCDDVWFLADSLANEAVIKKYHIIFLYDVRGYLDTLDAISHLEGSLFIPAHTEPLKNIQSLIKINISKTYEIIELLKGLVKTPMGFDDLLKAVFDHYGLIMDFNQYALVGCTIRSYLSYLLDLGEICASFEGNKIAWHTAT